MAGASDWAHGGQPGRCGDALARSRQVAGRYVANKRVTRPSRRARDPVLAARLWEESCRLTGLPLQPEL
jgi:hypothetical protein